MRIAMNTSSLRKGRKLLWLAVLAAALLTGCAKQQPEQTKPEEPEEMVTVYVLTSKTIVLAGTEKYGERRQADTYEYNDRGDLVRVVEEVETEEEKGQTIVSVTYDDRGSKIGETRTMVSTDPEGKENSVSQNWFYDITYGENGKPIRCQSSTQFADGERRGGEDYCFTYDERGNLILAEENAQGFRPWQHYTYDEQGRLVQETFCSLFRIRTEGDGSEMLEYRVKRWYYSYDAQGRVCQVSSATAVTDTLPTFQSADELEFQFSKMDDWECLIFYDEAGRLSELRQRSNYQEGGYSSYRYAYDDQGLPLRDDDITVVYDDHGNLIREETVYTVKYRGQYVEKRDVVEWTYEALLLPASQAAEVEREKRCAFFGDAYALIYAMMFDLYRGQLADEIGFMPAEQSRFWYYHLIPNPVW